MNDGNLRELHAHIYPLAARAMRSHGLRWTGERTDIDALDWPGILIALHGRALVAPGPTVEGVSIWYVTCRCTSSWTNFEWTLSGLVGRG